MLLNFTIPNCSLDICHYAHVALTPHQRSFFLQQMDTITEGTTDQNTEKEWFVGCLARSDESIIQRLHLKLREHHRRRDKKNTVARGPGKCCEILSPPNDRESFTHDPSTTCLPKLDCKKHTTNRQPSTGEGNLMGPTSRQRITGNQEMLRTRKIALPRDETYNQ